MTTVTALFSSWLQEDLDSAVTLLLEHLVRLRCLVQRQGVGGEALHTERIVIGEQRQDVIHPPLDVCLPPPQLNLLVENRQHRQRVGNTAVDSDHRDRAAPSYDVYRQVEGI